MEGLIRKYCVPVSRKLIEVVERGQRDGEFRRVDSHHTVISLVALNVFYFSAARMVRIVARIDPYSAGKPEAPQRGSPEVRPLRTLPQPGGRVA